MGDRRSILVIAPHPDDEAIGCGGAVCLHADRGDRVAVVCLTSGELGIKGLPPAEVWRVREAEAIEAGRVLGTAETVFLRRPDGRLGDDVPAAAAALAPVLARVAPGLVYVPHAGERHPDHRAALPILRAAFGAIAAPVPALRCYEVWTPLAGHGCAAEDVTAVMSRKLRAVRAHRSQVAALPYDRAVRGLNAYRGATAARCRYAEVFDPINPEGVATPTVAAADETR